ncbi:Protein GLUTAMINE DUMPER 2 [Fagus crenata]|uniref:Uncharacterized protein n=1 Tax=Fagus sylvatica TaxID=28930 RepID=A0A2N9GMM3_FAGSY
MASSSASGVRVWKSPIPYLFGGLALTLLLIAVALIILVCSYRKRTVSNEEKPPTKMMNTMVDTEPKIVVIMAGDDKPTYLAKPVTSTSSTCPTDQV